MRQLDLFDNQQPKKNNDTYLHMHLKAIGGGNYDEFLQIDRDIDNTIVSLSNMYEVGKKLIKGKYKPVYRISITTYSLSDLNSIDDIPLVKRLLFTFDADEKEWIHKPVYNFKINSMLHDIYDDLNERSNNV